MSIKESDVRMLLDSSPICNKIIDLNGKLQFMSAAGVNGLKIKNIEQYYGKEYPVDFFPEEAQSILRQYVKRAIQGEACSVDTLGNDTEGNLLWFKVSFVPVFDDESGKLKFILGASVDITEQVRYRNNLEQEVQEKTREKLALQEQLYHTQKMDAIGKLAGGFAHDFNNMLAGVMGQLEMMLAKEDDPSKEQKIQKILEACKKSAGIISNILNFSRKASLIKGPIFVVKAINEVLEISKSTLHKNIQFIFDSDLLGLKIFGDENKFHSTLLNIVLNAQDSMPDGGNIIIEINTHNNLNYLPNCDSGIDISIKDNGCGMSKETMDKAFEPFFTTKPLGKGTGLGLSSAYGIVNEMCGEIQLESEIGAGTIVKIRLPIYAEDESNENSASEEKLKITASNSGSILIVDDNEMVRSTLKDQLNLAGYKTVLCESGEKCLYFYKSHYSEIDLILLDVIMPGISGVELYKKIKKIDSNTKVIVISGYTEGVANDMIKAGANAFLQKPYPMSDLLKLVKQTILR